MSQKEISRLRSFFEEGLDELILNLDTPLELLKPMLYSLKNGGKRLRPVMLLAITSAVSDKLLKKAIRTAVALEFIHTYSLIHDDLPAMDDDDLRRGQPTSHVKFDEATAILAGDALLTDAFHIIAEDPKLKNKEKVAIISRLAQAAGSNGMVAGQFSDIKADNTRIAYEDLKQIHYLKTGKLFIFAIEAAIIIAEMDKTSSELVRKFANHFGVAYQIHNDVIDLTDFAGHGRSSDQMNDKVTYPALIGMDESKEALATEIEAAEEIIKELVHFNGKKFNILKEFIAYLEV